MCHKSFTFCSTTFRQMMNNWSELSKYQLLFCWIKEGSLILVEVYMLYEIHLWCNTYQPLYGQHNNQLLFLYTYFKHWSFTRKSRLCLATQQMQKYWTVGLSDQRQHFLPQMFNWLDMYDSWANRQWRDLAFALSHKILGADESQIGRASLISRARATLQDVINFTLCMYAATGKCCHFIHGDFNCNNDKHTQLFMCLNLTFFMSSR